MYKYMNITFYIFFNALLLFDKLFIYLFAPV